MRKFILLLLFTNTITSSHAQNYEADSVYYSQIAKPKIKQETKSELPSKTVEYFFAIQGGTLVGCNDCNKGKEFTFSAATVHGVAISKRFRTGIGLGFDSYQNWQTLPLFGMASWNLIGNKNKNALFAQLAYGWSHPWFVRDGAYSTYDFDPFVGVKGGRMINPQIGYRINYYNLKLSLVIGYKFQRIIYKRIAYYNPLCLACNSAQLSYDEITQDMNRFQLVMSVGWK